MQTDFWYYLDRARKRHGPADAQQIRGALHDGEIDARTLAWREGMDAWLPLVNIPEFAEFASSFSHHNSPQPSTGAAANLSHYSPSRAHHDRDVVNAGFWRRWVAFMVDQLVIVLPLLALTLLIGWAGGAFRNIAQGDVGGLHGLYSFLYFFVAALYYSLQESGTHQATIGKRLLGIKVTDLAGKRITLPRALLRWLSAGLSYITLYIGFLMAAFTHEKRALHDFIMDTRVVDRWAYTRYPERQRERLSGWVIAFIVMIVLALPVLGIIAAISVPAYQGYMAKSHVAAAVASAEPAKRALEHALANDHGRTFCPRNGENGLLPAEQYASAHIQAIEFGSSPYSARCAMALTLDGARVIVGQVVLLEFDPDNRQWHCRSTLPAQFLPSSCLHDN